MVIVDYSGTFISVLYASRLMDMFDAGQKEEPDINLVRHAVLNTLRSYKKMFKQKGSGDEMIIAADAGRSWRKDHYKYYKENRKKNRDSSPTDWNAVFGAMNVILQEINEFTPFKTLKVAGAEADDIIAILIGEKSKNYVVEGNSNRDSSVHSLFDEIAAEDSHSDISFIVSEDRDFHQLQKFAGVQQFYPRKKKFFIEDDPRDSLMKKIIFGDAGDGVPNVFSDDDTFVSEKRQKVINQKRFEIIEPWAKRQIQVEDSLYDQSIKDPELDIISGWCRNRKMIDLGFIPEDIKSKILCEYGSQKDSQKTAAVMLDYLFAHRCKNLVSDIQDFF